MIPIIKCDSIIKVIGRGNICLLNIPTKDPLPQLLSLVEIGNRLYQITGIEASMAMMSPPFRKEPVGLVIRDVTDILTKWIHDHRQE